MTKTVAEQILINDCFATKNGKKAAIKELSRKGAVIMNDKYPILDGVAHEIRIDSKRDVLVLRAFGN